MNFPIPSIVLQLPRRIVPPYSWIEHIPFAFYTVEQLKPSVIVELGVHTGNSFNAFCQAVKQLDLMANCYGVDTWKGDEHTGQYHSSVYKKLKFYQSKHYSEFAHLVESDFDDALDMFDDGSIDLLHIDGYHTYEAVKNDFFNWKPKLSDRSVVLFHDTQVRLADFGVYQLWDEVSKEYLSFEFIHGAGLGVLMTGKETPEFIFHYNNEEKELVKKVFKRLGNYVKARVALSQFIPDLGISSGLTFKMVEEQHSYYNQILSENTELHQKIHDYERSRLVKMAYKLSSVLKNNTEN